MKIPNIVISRPNNINHIHALESLFIISFFLSIYRRGSPLGMFGEHKKS